MQDYIIHSIFSLGYFRKGREHSSRKKPTTTVLQLYCAFPTFPTNIIKILPIAFQRRDFSYDNDECFPSV